MKRMKKKFLVNALQINLGDDGMGKYALSILEILERHFSATVEIHYLLTNSGRRALRDKVPMERMISFDYDKSMGFIRKFLKENFVIPFLIHRLKPEFYWSLDGKLPLVKWDQFKEIITIHDLGYIEAPEHYPLTRRLYWKWIYRRTAPRSYLAIAISDFTKAQALEHLKLDGDRVVRISPTVRDDFSGPTTVHDQVSGKYMLYYGQLTSRKNIRGLIEAYGIYLAETPDPLKLILAGADKSKTYLSAIRKSISDWGIDESLIDFVGYVPDEALRGYIEGCHFVINPSFYEGFGLPVIESFQMEKLILVSKNTPMEEMIDAAERYTFNPRDSRSIAARIKEFSSLDAGEIYQEYLIESKKYRQELPESHSAEPYIDLLRQLLESD